ncbi:MAG: hypothetical protein A3A88_00220 [Nitrospirae bacterium RIFCSPLOWO2_01_FULL_62_17]|nr:MAG: hypothetical protein A3A88_00220 [Nitrospirae bacterium RIFCSPLOWO2_01_FULL_62_17]
MNTASVNLFMGALTVMVAAEEGEYSIRGKKEQPSLDGEFRPEERVVARIDLLRGVRAAPVSGGQNV